MKALQRIDNFLAKIEGWLIVIFVWTMVILTFLQVCLRGLYTHAHLKWANMLMGYLDWSEPLVRLLVLWLTFLGATLLTRENGHVRIDLFATLLPQKWLALRELILSLACVFISCIMFLVCTHYVSMEMEYGGTMFLGLPNWAGQLILPLGFLLILFHFLVRAIDQGIRVVAGGITK